MTMPMSKRTLILVRHAKAEKVVGKPDHDRELAPRGRKDAHAAGEWLCGALQAGVLLDMVLCSTSERTRQTLDEVCAGGASVRETRFDERIYDGSAAALIEVLREVPDTVHTVLMIGHAPGIPVLATVLVQDGAGSTDAAERLNQGFPTSGLAVLGFEGGWAELEPDTAHLQEFVVPRG
jgi:phosphohistidine phosphatase